VRERAWSLRRNLTAADALFVALAEQLGERLATKDVALAKELATHPGFAVLKLADLQQA
jgi:predicted nucleic acid-binding protein